MSTPAAVARREQAMHGEGVSLVMTAEQVRALPWDDRRGTWGMWLFILSEAMIFVGLFFSYYYLANHSQEWPPEKPASLTIPLIILAVLIASCIVLEWGRRALTAHAGTAGGARLALLIALACGAAYIALEVLSFRQYLHIVTPQSDSYGSIYYTILTIHGAHLVLGMLLMVYALLVPLEPTPRPPHRAYHNSALYWYFSTVVWLVIVVCMYLPPHFYR